MSDSFLVPDGGCPAGRTQCGPVCVDLATDVNNCGACGNACQSQDPCSAARCKGGKCGTVVAPDGSTCDDGLPCTEQDACESGLCVGVVEAGFCAIAGKCYPNGATESPGGCAVCDPGTSNTSWTYAAKKGCVTTLAGSGSPGHLDGAGRTARFNAPTGIALDASGNVYVADRDNHCIRRIAAGSGAVTTAAGKPGISGYANGAPSEALFNAPTGVAVHGELVYIADSGNHRIRTLYKGKVSVFAGNGQGYADGGWFDAKFDTPHDLSVDSSKTVYVADTGNHRIRTITAAGMTATLAGSGTPGFADGPRLSAQFSQPLGICALDGDVRVVAGDRVRIIDLDKTTVETLAGSGTGGFADGVGNAAMFNQPSGVTGFPTGQTLVADAKNHRIRVLSAGGAVATLAGTGVAGARDGLAKSATFNHPMDVAIHPATLDVYIADTHNHCIRLYTWK